MTGTGGAPHQGAEEGSRASHDEALRAAATDLFHTAIGFAVLGWQRAQVARRELERDGCPPATALTERASRIGADLRRRLDACAR